MDRSSRHASPRGALLLLAALLAGGACTGSSPDKATGSTAGSARQSAAPGRTDPPAPLVGDTEATGPNVIDTSGAARPGVTGDPSQGAPSRAVDEQAAELDSCIAAGSGCPDGERSFPGIAAPGLDAAGKDLHDMDLSGADLTRADLAGANLSGAVLAGADLAGADLSGADLTNTNLAGTNLFEAQLDGAKLDGAGYCVTTMPDGSNKTGDCERLGVASPGEDDS